MTEDGMVETNKLPDGYTLKTKCCMRCGHLLDCSHPDGLELYCNRDGVLTRDVQAPKLGSAEYDEYYEKRNALEMPRFVEAWATCDHWMERHDECVHGKSGYCRSCMYEARIPEE